VIIRCYTWDPIAADNVECSSVNFQGWQQYFFLIYVIPDNLDLPITWSIMYSGRPSENWTDTNNETSLYIRRLWYCDPFNDYTYEYEMTVTAENEFGSATNSYTGTIECNGESTLLFFPTIVNLPSQTVNEP
jgi:hypothetical protein